MAEWNCFKCKNEDDIALCARCEDGSEYITKTNADRIRSMTDEELAEFLLKVYCEDSKPCMEGDAVCKWEDYPTHDKGCKDCFKEWLQKDSEV